MSDAPPGVVERLAAADVSVDGAKTDGDDCPGVPKVKPRDGWASLEVDDLFREGGAPKRLENGLGASGAGVADPESGFDDEALAESLANLIGESGFQVLSPVDLVALWAALKMDGVLFPEPDKGVPKMLLVVLGAPKRLVVAGFAAAWLDSPLLAGVREVGVLKGDEKLEDPKRLETLPFCSSSPWRLGFPSSPY